MSGSHRINRGRAISPVLFNLKAMKKQTWIVGLLAAASAAGAVPGAASVSNDGYSVTFGSNASVTAAARQEAYEIIRTALGADPHGLLYRGIL